MQGNIRMTEVFDIASTTSKSPVMVMVIAGALVTLVTVGLFGYIGMTMNHLYVELTPDAMKIKIPMYSRTIPRSELLLDQVRVINMKAPDAPRFTMRTNGIGLPGFQAGWFRVKDIGKVLACVTDMTRVVVIPTTNDYQILVSMKDPESFVNSLHSKWSKGAWR